MRDLGAIWQAYQAVPRIDRLWRYELRAYIDNVLYTAADMYSDIKKARNTFDNGPLIGTCPSQYLELTVRDIAEIPPNAQVRVELRIVQDGEEPSPWVKFGTFFVDTRTIGVLTNTTLLKCYDRMLYTEETYIQACTRLAITPLPTSDTASNILATIGLALGVDVIGTITTNAGLNISNSVTCRELLAAIATMNGGNFVITDDDELKFIELYFDVVNIGQTAYSAESKRCYVGDTAVIKRIVLTSTGSDDADWGGLEAGLPMLQLSIPAIHTGYTRKQIADYIYSVIEDWEYTSYTSPGTILDPAIEFGDSIMIEGYVVPVVNIAWYGLLAADLDAPLSGNILSEFPAKSANASLLSQVIAELPPASLDPEVLEEIKTAYELAIENATDLITGSVGGHILIRQDINGKPQEIFIMDTEDAETAQAIWRWNIGGFGYSSTGIDGPYGTAITMDGHIVAEFITAFSITADEITAGILKSHNEEWEMDLDAGTFNLGSELSFDGHTLSFGSGVVNSLTASKGNIAELTVDRLETADKVAKYEAEDTSDVNFIRVYDQTVDFVTATVSTGTAIVLDRNGQQLFYADAEHTYTTLETTNFPVLTYAYTELVKMSWSFVEIDGTYKPTIVLGAGSNVSGHPDYGKAFIYKGTSGLYLEYLHSVSGLSRKIKLTDEGIDFSEAVKMIYSDDVVIEGMQVVDVLQFSVDTTITISSPKVLICTSTNAATKLILPSAATVGVIKNIFNNGTGRLFLEGNIVSWGTPTAPLYPGENVEIVATGTSWLRG